MEASPGPPPVTPRPPDAERPEDEHRRLRIWLAVVTVVALAAAGVGGYALSEATKEEKPDDTPIRTLRAEMGALERRLESRTATLDRKFDEQVGERDVQALARTVEDLEGRVEKLENANDGDETDELATRLDELEQQLEDAANDEGRP